MKLHKCLKKLSPGQSAVCQQFPFLGPATLKEGLKLTTVKANPTANVANDVDGLIGRTNI